MARSVRNCMNMFAFLGALWVASTTLAAETGNLQRFRKVLTQVNFIVQDGRVDFPEMVELCCQYKLP